MKQFEENLSRIANGQKTLQQDNKTYDFHEAEPIAQKTEKSFFTECLDYQLKIDGRIDLHDKEWCSCLNETFLPRLSKSEIKSYTDNFKQFYENVGVTPNDNPKNTWANYEAFSRFQRR